MRKLLSLMVAALLIGSPLVVESATTGISAKPVRVLVKALSTSNLTLSGAQTIDSVAVVAGDLVGAVGQSDNHNAIYLVQSGAWKIANPGFGTGLEIYALNGGSNANKVYGADTTGAITWGSTSVTFTLKTNSGAAFNPASPGAIGGTTPAAGTFTTLKATSYLTLNAGIAPSPLSDVINVFTGNGQNLAFANETGEFWAVQNDSTTGTSQITKRFMVVSLVDDGTSDITLLGFSLGGHGIVSAPGATGSTSCAFSFAANAATTDNGLTGTNCAVADTDTKLCAFASGGKIRIKNRLGSTQTVLVELTESNHL